MKTIYKTTGNKNRRIGKALIRLSAIAVSIVLMSLTVHAQELWKNILSYNSFGEIAKLMIDESIVASKGGELPLEDPILAKSMSFQMEMATDTDLEIEDWMTDEAFFSKGINTENDRELELENWTTDAGFRALPRCVNAKN